MSAVPFARGAAVAAAAFLLALAACHGAGPSQAAPLRYPAARTVDVVDDYHGTPVADPYRWMEDTEAPETRAWAAAQTALARPFLAEGALRAWLLSRMEVHAEGFDAWDADSAARAGPLAFKLQPAPEGDRSLLTVQDPGDAPPRVLVDPRDFGAQCDITRFQVSPDRRLVAWALSEGGSEWVTTRIRDVAGGTDLPEVLHGLLFEPPVWTHDSRGLLYVHQQRAAPELRSLLQGASLRHHVVGTDPSQDTILFTAPEASTEIMLEIELSDDGRLAFLYEGTGAHGSGMGWVLTRAHVLDLRDAAAPDLSGAPVALSKELDAAYRVVGTAGTVLTVLTDRGAPRRRLVAVDLADPSPSRWRELVPEAEGVLQWVLEINGRFAAVYLEDVQHVVRVFERDGRLLRTLDLPPLTTVMDIEPGATDAGLLVTTTSFFQAPAVTRWDVLTGASHSVHAAVTRFAAAEFEARQVWYASKDGTRVPMFLLHRKGLVLDGAHPTVLYGYGASGTVMSPFYSEDVLAWLELGGVFALPSLRGGGEFGRAWYEAGTLGRKQVSFDDFIAAAEYLISEGFTSPEKLAIRGISNGGLLVTGTLAQRPELFAAAIAEVPLTDNLRYDRGRHRAQFGSPLEATQFPFLHAYSPLHRIVPGTCYPATLVTTSMNDERAPAWHALKFVAALQAAQSCDRPVLLRADETGGHGGNRGPDSFFENAADILVFTAARLGVEAPAAPAR